MPKKRSKPKQLLRYDEPQNYNQFVQYATNHAMDKLITDGGSGLKGSIFINLQYFRDWYARWQEDMDNGFIE